MKVKEFGGVLDPTDFHFIVQNTLSFRLENESERHDFHFCMNYPFSFGISSPYGNKTGFE